MTNKTREEAAQRRELESVFPGSTIDAELLPLIEALRGDGHATQGSCSGHMKSHAYVDLAINGTGALRSFVMGMNQLATALATEADFEVALNWCDEVATACDFDTYPNWIMVTLTIKSADGGPPSRQVLASIAATYTRLVGAASRHTN